MEAKETYVGVMHDGTEHFVQASSVAEARSLIADTHGRPAECMTADEWEERQEALDTEGQENNNG
ncbi:MAG: hypothetical protein AAFQ82_05860 [Myxococcota bacterium]